MQMDKMQMDRMQMDKIAREKIIKLLNKNKHKIPNNAFGVFATIRRSIKLSTYPEDIHGCIGYWTPDYSILKKKDLISHLMDVTQSALYNDDRRKYFPPIEEDLGAIIEIDFMIKPLIPINEKTGILETGELFKNSEYGLIVESKYGSRATYLPYVFPDKTKWQNIKQSLISKAGAGDSSGASSGASTNISNKFFAYSIIQLKGKIFDLRYKKVKKNML